MSLNFSFSSFGRILGSLAVAAGLGGNFVGTVLAEEGVLREPFSAPEGGLPAGWVAIAGSPGQRMQAEIVADAEGHGPALLQARSPLTDEEPTGSTVVFFEGNETLNGNFQDCSGSVVYIGGGQRAGIVLRAAEMKYSKQGYFIAVVTTGTSRSLQISYKPPSHTDPGQVLAAAPLPFEVRWEPLLLKFSAIGTRIEASLYYAGAENPSPSDAIASVQTDDAIPDYGYFGFRTAFGNTSSVYWKNLELTIHP